MAVLPTRHPHRDRTPPQHHPAGTFTAVHPSIDTPDPIETNDFDRYPREVWRDGPDGVARNCCSDHTASPR
jgi:hypothetical protein